MKVSPLDQGLWEKPPRTLSEVSLCLALILASVIVEEVVPRWAWNAGIARGAAEELQAFPLARTPARYRSSPLESVL